MKLFITQEYYILNKNNMKRQVNNSIILLINLKKKKILVNITIYNLFRKIHYVY